MEETFKEKMQNWKFGMIRIPITEDQYKQCTDAGVQGNYSVLDSRPVMMITPRSSMSTIEGILGIEIIDLVRIPGFDPIVETVIKNDPIPDKLNFELGEWLQGSPKPFIKNFQELAQTYGSFMISHLRGLPAPLESIQKEKVSIFFNTGLLYSSAEKMTTNVSLFGISVESLPFRSTPEGLPLYEELTGITWGEIRGKTIYVFFSPFKNIQKGKESIPEIFKVLFDKLTLDTAKEIARIADLKKTRAMTMMKNIMVTEIKKGVAQKEELVKGIQKDILDCINRVGQLGVSLRSAQEDISAIQERFIKLEAGATKALEEIEKLPLVENIEFSPEGVLLVNTKTLTCENPNTHLRHWMGKFRIEFSFAEKWGIKFFNRTFRVRPDNHQATHVYDTGTPCYGNSQSTFSQLFAEGNLVGVIEYALLIPQSVNITDSFGKHLPEWPLWKGSEKFFEISLGSSDSSIFSISEGETLKEAYSHKEYDTTEDSFKVKHKNGKTTTEKGSKVVNDTMVMIIPE